MLIAICLLPGGVLIGTAAVLVHDTWWGLPLSVLSALVTARALWGGLTRIAFSFGWAIAVGAAAVPRPAGGYFVAGGLNGYALLLTALVLAVAAMATVPARTPPNERSGDTFPTMTP